MYSGDKFENAYTYPSVSRVHAGLARTGDGGQDMIDAACNGDEDT